MTRRTLPLLAFLVALFSAPAFTRAGGRGEEPTTVSLRLRDVPAAEAYAQIAEQAGLTIKYGWGPPLGEDKHVTANFVHEPFWSAMARVGKVAKMEPVQVRREPGHEVWLSPHLVMNLNKPVASSVDGLFIGVLYDRVMPELRKEKPDATRRHATELAITLRGEPKIRPMLWHSIRVEQLVDDTGRPIDNKVIYPAPQFRDGSATTMLRLAERPSPRSVGRLRVTGKVLASLRSEVFELPDVMADNPDVANAAGFKIESETKPGPRGRQVTLDMTRLTHVSPDWLRPSSRLGLLEPVVLAEDGRPYVLHTVGRDWLGRTCRLRLEAVAPRVNQNQPPYGPPKRLVMEIPTEVIEYDVTLEFTDADLF